MKKTVDMEHWNGLFNALTKDLKPYSHYDDGYRDAFDYVDDWLEAQPDAKEKRGEWIDLTDGDYQCSKCKEIFAIGEDYHPIHDCGLYYCSNCGAKMDLGEKEWK